MYVHESGEMLAQLSSSAASTLQHQSSALRPLFNRMQSCSVTRSDMQSRVFFPSCFQLPSRRVSVWYCVSKRMAFERIIKLSGDRSNFPMHHVLCGRNSFQNAVATGSVARPSDWRAVCSSSSSSTNVSLPTNSSIWKCNFAFISCN